MKRMMSLPQHLIRLGINSSSFDFFVLRKNYSLSHLRYYQEYAAGPIQRDEALLLYALVKTVDPKTVVEFGFLVGDSAINFLKAMSADARLYSYDVTAMSMHSARKIRDDRFTFILKSQAEFQCSDVDKRLVDLVLFDGSHDFHINMVTLKEVMKCLSERALIIVHDTGAWYGDMKGFQTSEGYFIDRLRNRGYIHRPDERKFVNYIRENIKDFDQIHLHSTSKFRHGLTVLQRNDTPLSV